MHTRPKVGFFSGLEITRTTDAFCKPALYRCSERRPHGRRDQSLYGCRYMQMGFRFAALFAFAVVAGCAGGKSVPRDAAVVTISTYGPDLFGHNKHGEGGDWDVRGGTGRATPLGYPPMDVRECNQSKTACSLGIGVVDGTAEVISENDTGATVEINLNYRVARSYSFNVNGRQNKREVPPGVQALQANQVIAKKIEVAYGEVVHLKLPYGVDVAVCAQKLSAGEMIPDRRVCKEY